MGNTETLVHIGCWSWGRRLPRRSGKVPQRCREHNEGLFVEQLFFYTTLACVKLSLLFFFRRVGWYMTKLRVAWWSVLGFVVACWIASVGDAQWGCLVATGFDIMAQCTEPPAIAYANLTLRVNCALDVLSDAAGKLCFNTVRWVLANNDSPVHPHHLNLGRQIAHSRKARLYQPLFPHSPHHVGCHSEGSRYQLRKVGKRSGRPELLMAVELYRDLHWYDSRFTPLL